MEGNRVKGFAEKEVASAGLINGGHYWVRKDVLSYVRQVPSSMERDVIPPLAREGLIWGWPYDGFFIDIGLPEDIGRARAVLPDRIKKPAVFLDRDGVLNVDKGHVHLPEDFVWTDGAIDAVKYLNDRGYLLIVVTNQGGVARGYYTEQKVIELHNWMNEELSFTGAHIDAFYHCPHHPQGEGPHGIPCGCRKPAPGLFLQAMKEWPVDKRKSIAIGDKETDLEAARKAGIKGVLFSGENLLKAIRNEKL